MSPSPVMLPTTRSWRDIPQQVTSRAMGKEGRKRVTVDGLKVAGVIVVVALVALGAWQVNLALQDDPKKTAVVARAEPVKDTVLTTDGVLDRAPGWLARTLALPKGAALTELDLPLLRARLLASGQVSSADLVCNFPATLSVRVHERTPVARLRTQDGDLLVARDGVVFAGAGFSDEALASWPWLDGVKLVRLAGGGYAPVEGMAPVADLLARAHYEADHLYQNWWVVSLARLASDSEIEVRTKGGATGIFFSTDRDFFQQLAKLDYITDKLAVQSVIAGEIHLGNGRDVTVQPLALPPKLPGISRAGKVEPAAAAPVAAPKPPFVIPDFSNLLPKTKS